MFGNANTVIRKTIEILNDPAKWNSNGSYIKGKHCIATAMFKAAVFDSDPIRDKSLARYVVQKIINNRFGASRGKRWDIIEFNDHPLTTHDDVLWVLRRAEERTRPFWRKPHASSASDVHPDCYEEAC